MHGPWVVGLIAYHLWSYAGNNDRKDVSQFLAQYFVNDNLPDAWYLTSSPIITANWEVEGKGQMDGSGGRRIWQILSHWQTAINGNVFAFANVIRPDAGSDWTLRVQLARLLPKSLFSN